MKLTVAAIAAAAGAGARAGAADGGSQAASRSAARGRVVVIGGGFSGAACASELCLLAPGLRVELIEPAETYVTCPMSNGALIGLRTLESLTVGHAGLERRGVRVIRDRVASIDPAGRRVRLDSGRARGYDRLVFAAGIRFLWDRPRGYTEAASVALPHAWQAGPQTRALAGQIQKLRDGGVVAISVPSGPMRCPPGPFERASLIASYLRPRNPRAKVLILDANNRFPRQDVFTAAWRDLYPGMIEWVSVIDGGAVERVDPDAMTLYTSRGAIHADVINVIPPQAPAQLAVDAGLASDHGWCPIEPQGFESTLLPGVHVIGDACIADPMPKAASSAVAQAKRCARAIVASLGGGRERSAAALESVCYSQVAPDRTLAIRATFEVEKGVIKRAAAIPSAPSPEAGPSAQEAGNAEDWYVELVAGSFGASAGAVSARRARAPRS